MKIFNQFILAQLRKSKVKIEYLRKARDKQDLFVVTKVSTGLVCVVNDHLGKKKNACYNRGFVITEFHCI